MDFQLTINGRRVAGSRRIPVINPATGRVFTEGPACSRDQLDEAMEAAQSAFGGWAALSFEERYRSLLPVADAVVQQVDALAPILTQEQGKPLARAAEEIQSLRGALEAFGALDLSSRVVRDDARTCVEIRRKPLGVVAAIGTWNYPLMVAAAKVWPALLAGNTVVLKPSPFTPLATLRFGEIAAPLLPPGVLNVVSGSDDLGAWMSEHPRVRKISFTGSISVGKRIMAAAATDLKRITLELGGNDPAIVLGDVVPEKIAKRLFWGAFVNSGQLCVAAKRVYVDDTIHDRLVTALADVARSVRVGNGLEPDTELGPVNNRAQYDRVNDLIQSAREDGARFAAGGAPATGDGYFIAPTLVTEISDGTRLVDEEQFGPVLPIIRVRSVEDALERANAGHFGLGGSVWTSDPKRGAELVGQLECGTGWVNQHGTLSYDAPSGGWKSSGIGHENGLEGLQAFTAIQVISTRR